MLSMAKSSILDGGDRGIIRLLLWSWNISLLLNYGMYYVYDHRMAILNQLKCWGVVGILLTTMMMDVNHRSSIGELNISLFFVTVLTVNGGWIFILNHLRMFKGLWGVLLLRWQWKSYIYISFFFTVYSFWLLNIHFESFQIVKVIHAICAYHCWSLFVVSL